MRKYLLSLIFVTLILGWCGQKTSDDLDVNAITDLVALQDMITKVSIDMDNGSLSPKDAQTLIDALQDRYLELTDITQQNIEVQFEEIQKTFSQQSVPSYSLPLWARKLWMSEPKGMELNKVLSKATYTNDEGYSSTILVYKGDYAVAMQQAEIMAKKANLSVSKEFEKAQSLAQVGDIKYISGLDTDILTKGIIYTNHELLDMNIENLLSISVDQDGTLIVEATKYK